MNKNLCVYHIENSGIIFKNDEVMVIIDGIMLGVNGFGMRTKENGIFLDKLLEDYQGQVIAAFTHLHSDHYDEAKVLEYLKMGKIDLVFLPKKKLEKKESEHNVKAISKDIVTVETEETKLFFYKTAHLPYQGHDGDLNYSITVEIADKKYLLLGDTSPESLDDLFGKVDKKLDGIFINPIILGKEKWLEKIDHYAEAVKVYVYHLPDETNDLYGYGKLAKSNFKRFARLRQNLFLLTNTHNEIF